MARITARIGSTEYSSENGRTIATSPGGTTELAEGRTYTDPETGAQVTPRGNGVHIIGNVTGGLSCDFS
ncbi:hypothetical protein ACGFX7_03805 [Streptomyces harbinensis]|uniref:hypothetical protein n=1 Tax=Streptomyces harbinensis TaxID=1176198 RepID=UPI0037232B59